MTGLVPLGFGQRGTAFFLTTGFTGTDPNAPGQPNVCRTIDAECCGNVGMFCPYWSTEADAATFELAFILSGTEEITSVIDFSLTPEGPGSVTDPSPADRILGIPGVNAGTAVSQRFGNWQTDVAQIMYRVNLSVMTTFGNVKSLYAFVVVNQPPQVGC